MTHTNLSLPRGFSLIEILVGMAVALLATLVIAQMYTNFEGQKPEGRRLREGGVRPCQPGQGRDQIGRASCRERVSVLV